MEWAESAESEVAQLDLEVFVEQDVAGFDVQMVDAAAVQMLHGIDQHGEVGTRHVLSESALTVDQLGKLATFCVLQHKNATILIGHGEGAIDGLRAKLKASQEVGMMEVAPHFELLPSEDLTTGVVLLQGEPLAAESSLEHGGCTTRLNRTNYCKLVNHGGSPSSHGTIIIC